MQYRNYRMAFVIFLLLIVLLIGCGRNTADAQISSSRAETGSETAKEGQDAMKETSTEARADTERSTDAGVDNIVMSYSADTKVWDVIDNPAFEGYGRLIFPADKTIDKRMTLSAVGSIVTWYNYVNPDRTVEIVNYMKAKAEAGKEIFHDIYTDEEKAADPAKKNTGLFFFGGILVRNLPL